MIAVHSFTPDELEEAGTMIESLPSFPRGKPIPADEARRWGQMLIFAARRFRAIERDQKGDRTDG